MLQAVSVTYPGRSVAALPPVSFELVPGRVTALVGESGCGKTTLLAALLGFVAPTAGRVLGGVPLADLDLAAWRERVAWVGQDPALLGPTVADDVRLGRPGASDSEVTQALRGAGLDPDRLGRGSATAVGDLAADVSAGQRRRVALARVLLRQAPLVLLDEPTAALDEDAEADVVRAVRALADAGAAVLVVAHRPALAAMADAVVDLAPAAVVAS